MIDDLLRCLGAGVLSENVTSLGCEIVHSEVEERMWPVLAAVKLQTSRSMEPGILMGSPDMSTACREDVALLQSNFRLPDQWSQGY